MKNLDNVNTARDEVFASSAGGAPFLLAFGATILLTALASLALPLRTAALILLFQGNVALPLAWILQRRMATATMSADNPLRALSIQVAMSQIVALPAVIIVFYFAPWAVPAAFAAVGGAHFFPYSWLQRTPVYVALGITISAGSCIITALLREQAFAPVLFFVSACYAVSATVIMRRRRRPIHSASSKRGRLAASGPGARLDAPVCE
jgi:hypothetical protein